MQILKMLMVLFGTVAIYSLASATTGHSLDSGLAAIAWILSLIASVQLVRMFTDGKDR
ncbi:MULTISPECIES: hypothetical protein [Brevibacillus]|jgi:hypothetical protein|uniref:hypothetical protein n=1 Tax=Brevibacillus TaxID=55080 RepID=UPI0003AA46DF|nr:hypothetical protein [Brevibacillus borstelensis]MBE5396972.1 hypothetical protein [Brevibacillus borstelensis]MCC0567093.1 hypothetical protein [Brevibacillus borstelensis]MCM3471758.1 hypothetical protein [Brevibacillus borstelensis]MCM3557550.1 hypothetical protein [Brevibacillus borstelensis]MCM3593722.1 hypothetical protein [Brevibacillus borstelensis]